LRVAIDFKSQRPLPEAASCFTLDNDDMMFIMSQQDSSLKRGSIVGAHAAPVPTIHLDHFDTREVASIVGVDFGKLQNWLTRGLIQLNTELNPGRGQSREYTAYEVARIRLMKKLADAGVPLSTAFKITGALKRRWEETPGGHESYGSEPHLKSLLLVLSAAEWPVGYKASMVRTDDYVALWLVDERHNTDKPRGLRATLAELRDATVVVINMGAFLQETLSRLAQLLEARRKP
jgi:DNA-binding transcriptional MerR regulator